MGLFDLFSLTFFVLQDVGGEAALVSNIGGVLAVFLLDDILQVVVDLSTNTHGLLEAAGSNRQDHELLHGQLVACMGSAVDDIESLKGSGEVAFSSMESQLINDSLGSNFNGTSVRPISIKSLGT